jgi:hypothetical protein
MRLELDLASLEPWDDCGLGECLDYSLRETFGQRTQLNPSQIPDLQIS